jgi:hypothetical protein
MFRPHVVKAPQRLRGGDPARLLRRQHLYHGPQLLHPHPLRGQVGDDARPAQGERHAARVSEPLAVDLQDAGVVGRGGRVRLLEPPYPPAGDYLDRERDVDLVVLRLEARHGLDAVEADAPDRPAYLLGESVYGGGLHQPPRPDEELGGVEDAVRDHLLQLLPARRVELVHYAPDRPERVVVRGLPAVIRPSAHRAYPSQALVMIGLNVSAIL